MLDLNQSSAKWALVLLAWTGVTVTLFELRISTLESKHSQQVESLLQSHADELRAALTQGTAGPNAQPQEDLQLTPAPSLSTFLPQAASASASWQHAVATSSPVVSKRPRQLAAVWGSVAAHDTATTQSGCSYISANTAVTLSDKGCGTGSDQVCPLCYILTGTTAVTLTLNDCSTAYVGKDNRLNAGTILTNAVLEFMFINVGSANFNIADNGGGGGTTITAGTAGAGYCLSTTLAGATSYTANQIIFH